MAEVFSIIPAPPRALWTLVVFIALLASLLLILGYFGYSSQATRVEVSAEGLRIRGNLYGRMIPWSTLNVDEAMQVDLQQSPEYRPTMRTNGIGLPGYRAGWFRLRGGRGLLFVTDPSRVVAIPTTEGYTLMLSVADPADFLRALESARPPS